MKKLLAAVTLAFVCISANAATTPIKVSLWGSIAYPSAADTVVKGLDIGIGSTTAEVKGVQLDFIFSKTSDLTGVQSGLLGMVDTGIGGQVSAVNIANDFTGLQWGLFNYAERVKGLQLGFVNYAQEIDKGLQIGLLNFAKNGWLPVMIIVNGKF